MHIASNLRFLRKREGWTQQEAAQYIRVTLPLYGAWEEQRSEPAFFDILNASWLHVVPVAALVELDLQALKQDEIDKVQMQTVLNFSSAPLVNHLSDNLVYLRHSQKMSQEATARQFNIKRARLAAWEENRASPDLKTGIQIARFFNRTIEELFTAKLSPESWTRPVRKKKADRTTPKRIYRRKQHEKDAKI